MTEYAHSGRRFRLLPESADKECKVIYGACYALFLIRAVVTRAHALARQEFNNPSVGIQRGQQRRERVGHVVLHGVVVCEFRPAQVGRNCRFGNETVIQLSFRKRTAIVAASRGRQGGRKAITRRCTK